MTESKYGAIGIIGCNKRTTLNAYIEETKELEQYRAIGTVEELQKMKADYAEAIIDWRRYKKIGTIERFRELTENNDRIIEILRTHRFTDEECIERITEIVGIHSQN